MPRETNTVIVAEVPGEKMRFHVESWSRENRPHLVDLLAHAGLGECSCKDWQTRAWPRIRDGETNGTRCRHITAARDYFLNALLARMAAHE